MCGNYETKKGKILFGKTGDDALDRENNEVFIKIAPDVFACVRWDPFTNEVTMDNDVYDRNNVDDGISRPASAEEVLILNKAEIGASVMSWDDKTMDPKIHNITSISQLITKFFINLIYERLVFNK